MRIQNYEFGRVKINGETYNNDVIILPDRVVPDWWRKSGHEVQIEDIEDTEKENWDDMLSEVKPTSGFSINPFYFEDTNEDLYFARFNGVPQFNRAAFDVWSVNFLIEEEL